ncbi:cation transporter [Sporolactobacillus sp. THM19-2]|jgi:copper chaperone|uniref:cation transporter n=1 Tax=Sporolactobacillus sp. THM19-2 TaxID=2511171 RepID=UPI001021DC1C|nr:cation transporter [Sporolactobacillus sp. THM19-2]RYL87521.1 copper chaperone [Sporolactobacillus sp. THM19-2]
MAKTTLNVKGMMGDHCKRLVTKTLKDLNGVSTAEVDLSSGQAAVEYDDTKVRFNDMKEAVEKQGYDVVGHN